MIHNIPRMDFFYVGFFDLLLNKLCFIRYSNNWWIFNIDTENNKQLFFIVDNSWLSITQWFQSQLLEILHLHKKLQNHLSFASILHYCNYNSTFVESCSVTITDYNTSRYAYYSLKLAFLSHSRVYPTSTMWIAWVSSEKRAWSEFIYRKQMIIIMHGDIASSQYHYERTWIETITRKQFVQTQMYFFKHAFNLKYTPSLLNLIIIGYFYIWDIIMIWILIAVFWNSITTWG